MFSTLFASILFAILIVPFSGQAQTFVKKFNFGERRIKDSTKILATDIYSKEKGYGFEISTEVICFDKFCSAAKPFYFSVAVPEGNYKIKVTFANLESDTNNTVKAELRRLMLENIEAKKGKTRTETFIVNVRNPNFPNGEVKLKDREKTMEVWAWDDKLTLEFNGENPNISKIEIKKIEVPIIYLLGDSTVCDQPGEPYASWGQMLTRFFQPQIAIANHAQSGESLKSSFNAKRLDKVLSLLKKGDYVFIQFGHNDMKEKGDGIGAFTSYKKSLKQYIDAIKNKGGNAVLITSMHRRTFDENGKITNSFGDYPEAVRQAAREENVPLIDLNAMSKDFYEALGKEGSAAAFKEGDGTHHNNYGAYEMAKMIVEGIRENKLPIAKYLIKGLPKYNPKNPDPPQKFNLPASPTAPATKPLGS